MKIYEIHVIFLNVNINRCTVGLKHINCKETLVEKQEDATEKKANISKDNAFQIHK